MSGIDEGLVSEEGSAFAAYRSISPSEAALILDRALNTTTVSYVSLDEELNPETAQACANLSACGIVREGKLIEEALSRGEAAQMLVRAWELLNNRK